MSAIGKDFNGQQVPFKNRDELGVVNGDITPIFEVQGDALTALQSLEAKTPALVGGEIPVNDDALYSMIDTLNELVSRLGILLSARAVDGTLRVSGTVGIGTITTLTTLTTLANQAALGGYQTTASIQNQMNMTAQLANTANIG